MKTLREVSLEKNLRCDCTEEAFNRPILYVGPGWYSLDDKGVYVHGEHATYSRIRLTLASFPGCETKVPPPVGMATLRSR